MKHLEPVDVSAPVSVIMTVLNEQEHLAASVRSVLENGYEPGVELVIAVGPSHDDTASIALGLASDHRVTVVDNPAGATPQGLNAALAVTTRDVIVRIDGHTVLPVGYIQTAVAALAETGAANVGGRMVPTAAQPFPRAVAVAMSSRWGIGGAGHRVGGEPGPAASVFLGTFRRQALEDVGGFSAHFARAQDWELNHRLAEAGYVVWFVPEMQVEYAPRSSWKRLAKQFYASGQWRREVTTRYPETVSVRYLAAPVVVLGLAVSLVAMVCALAFSQAWLWWAAIVPAAYLAGLLVATADLWGRAGFRAAVRLPWVIATMHVAWGLGFLRGVR